MLFEKIMYYINPLIKLLKHFINCNSWNRIKQTFSFIYFFVASIIIISAIILIDPLGIELGESQELNLFVHAILYLIITFVCLVLIISYKFLLKYDEVNYQINSEIIKFVTGIIFVFIIGTQSFFSDALINEMKIAATIDSFESLISSLKDIVSLLIYLAFSITLNFQQAYINARKVTLHINKDKIDPTFLKHNSIK